MAKFVRASFTERSFQETAIAEPPAVFLYALVIIEGMSRVLEEITARYPSFTVKLTSLSTEEASDLRLMGELASHVVDLFEAGEVEDVSLAFDLAEHLLASPIEAERDAAVLGFLETIQNVASHRKCGMAAFEPFLGIKSQAVWTEIMDVWRGKASLAEVVAAETGATLRRPWWQF